MELKRLGNYYRTLEEQIIEITINNEAVELKFPKNGLHHIAGIGYLTDLPSFQTPKVKENLVKALCENQSTVQAIKKSIHYDKVKNRIYYFNMLLWILLKDNVVLWAKTPKYSSIIADYLYVFEHTNNQKETVYIHFYIRKDDNADYYIPVSFFADTQNKSIKNTLKVLPSYISNFYKK